MSDKSMVKEDMDLDIMFGLRNYIYIRSGECFCLLCSTSIENDKVVQHLNGDYHRNLYKVTKMKPCCHKKEPSTVVDSFKSDHNVKLLPRSGDNLATELNDEAFKAVEASIDDDKLEEITNEVKSIKVDKLMEKSNPEIVDDTEAIGVETEAVMANGKMSIVADEAKSHMSKKYQPVLDKMKSKMVDETKALMVDKTEVIMVNGKKSNMTKETKPIDEKKLVKMNKTSNDINQPSTSTGYDENVDTYAKANNIRKSTKGNFAKCQVCNCNVPYDIKSLVDHVNGHGHKMALKMKNAPESNQQEIKPYKTVDIKQFSKMANMIYSFDKLQAVILKDSILISGESFCLIKFVNPFMAVCELCEDVLFGPQIGRHLDCDQHRNYVCSRIVVKDKEFIREIKKLKNIFHCGYCNTLCPTWKEVEEHLNTSDHKSVRAKAEVNAVRLLEEDKTQYNIFMNTLHNLMARNLF